MKTNIGRAALALTFALITAAGTTFAQEPASCCKRAQGKVRSENAERFRAKYGRDLPGAPVAAPAHGGCC